VSRAILLHAPSHDADEFMFALGGRDVLQGHLPPNGVFDNKPVGLLYLFGLAEMLAGQTVAAIHGLGLLAAAVTAWLLFVTARRLGLSAGTAIGLTALASVESVDLGGWLTISEVAATPLVAGANVILLSGRRDWRTAVFAAVLYGLACQVTYLAIPAVGLTMLGLVAEKGLTVRERGARALLLGAGGIAPVVAIWAPQIVAATWWPFLTEQAAYHAHYRLAHLSTSRIVQAIVGPMATFSLPFLIASLDLQRAGRALYTRPALLMGLQLVGVLLSTAASNRFYSHYLILGIPAFTMLLAILFAGLTPRHQALGGLVAAVCAVVLFLPNVGLLLRWPSDAGFERRASAMIDAKIGRRQSVLVFDETPTIYYLSGSQVAGRFAFPSHYMPSCGEVAMSNPEAVLREGVARKAKMILLGRECARNNDAETRVLQAGYRFSGEISEGARSIAAYIH